MALEAGIGKTAKEALHWLATHHEKWLLFLDNADYPDINL
jgi:hypothetical protein